MTSLKIDFCSYEAAKYACLNFHYSKAVPSGKLVKFGVWEDGNWVGSILYGLGATPDLNKLLDVKNTQICELVRVALTKHKIEVTRMIAITIRMLKKSNPGLKAIVSYADTDQGHSGGIYKGGNWYYSKKIVRGHLSIKGKTYHPRSVYAKYGTQSLKWLRCNIDKNAKYTTTKGKHRFIYFLDKELGNKYGAC